jgi:hypothetical protein
LLACLHLQIMKSPRRPVGRNGSDGPTS